MTNFVYPYKAGDWELKYSIRSIEKNFKGPFSITIIGDIPDWIDTTKALCIQYNNSNFDLPAQTKTNQKLLIAANIHKDFIWIADDHYIIKEITKEKLKQPRYLLKLPEKITPSDLFTERIVYTRDKLKEHNKNSKYTYTTHNPKFYESNKTKEIHQIFDITKATPKLSSKAFVFENLYYSYFDIDAIPIKDFRAGIWDSEDDVYMTENSYILNHNDQGLEKHPDILNFLQDSFPNKSKFEL